MTDRRQFFSFVDDDGEAEKGIGGFNLYRKCCTPFRDDFTSLLSLGFLDQGTRKVDLACLCTR